MKKKQVQTLIGAGWSIGNHTQNNVAMGSLPYADTLAELQAAIADLIEMGGSPYHMGYVSGQVADAQMADAGMLTGRKSNGNPFVISGLTDPYNVTSSAC